MSDPIAVDNLRRALAAMSRDDLDALTVEQLDRLDSDLGAWAGLAMVAAMTKRAAIRDEARQ
ncbi:MAG: hypothetical protein EOM21_19175 [Gammaproteobacteria bacterium]|nr:hypothetical protein [Gammaproteobacteria bacterium]